MLNQFIPSALQAILMQGPATASTAHSAPITAQAPANTDVNPAHLGTPADETSPAVMNAIMQRFLQDFEHVEVEYPIEGDANNPIRTLSHHPHLHFRMCSSDLEGLQPEQVAVYLGRQIDRGLFVMKKLGFEMDDFYVNPETGTLSYDARMPNLPEGITQKQALEQVGVSLQEACTQARAARQSVIAA